MPFPRTALAQRALRYASRIEDRSIFNHGMRTYLYGRHVGEQQGLLPGRNYDDELLFLGCVLHDAGLSDEGNGDQRFDPDGADLAARFLALEGLALEEIDVVWDAITLHLCCEVATRKRPEIALVTAGVGFDLGAGPGALPSGYADRVHANAPALTRGARPLRRDVTQALEKPQKTPPFSLLFEHFRQKPERPGPPGKN